MDGDDRRVRTSLDDIIIPPPPTSIPPLPPQDDDNAVLLRLRRSSVPRLPPLNALGPLLSSPGKHAAPSAEVNPAQSLAVESDQVVRVPINAATSNSEWLASPSSPAFIEEAMSPLTPLPPSPTCATPTPPVVAAPTPLTETVTTLLADMLSPVSTSSTTPSPEPTSEPSSPSSDSSLVSLPSSGSCSCHDEVDEAGKKRQRCTCSYAARLQRWVREQSHFVTMDDEETTEDPTLERDEPTLGLDSKALNAIRRMKSKENDNPNKWYWQSNTASFKSSSGRQSWEEDSFDVRADSPVLGAFEYAPEPGPSHSRVVDADAIVRKPSPPLLRTSSLGQTSPSQQSQGSSHPSAAPADTETITSPTETFISAVSGGSGSTIGTDEDGTVHGHDLDQGETAYQPQARGRSQSASVVQPTEQAPRRGGHTHSLSVSTAYPSGYGLDDFQLRYQTALGLEQERPRGIGLEPAFELEQSANTYGDFATGSHGREASLSEAQSLSGPVPNPLQTLLSTPPSDRSPGLMPPPPTAASFTTPITPRTPRSPTNINTPRTPRTPPTLSRQASMASLRHAVYIIDSEEVRERLDELVRRESMTSLSSLASQQQAEFTPPPTSARFGRSRSQSLVSVVESEHEEMEYDSPYGSAWRSREGELGLDGVRDLSGMADDEDDEDRRNTLCAPGLDSAVRAMGLDKLDPVAASRERNASVSAREAALGEDVDYRAFLSERFVEDVEPEENEGHGEEVEEEHIPEPLDEGLERFSDLFHRPANPVPQLSQSVSVPTIPVTQPTAPSSPSLVNRSPGKLGQSHSIPVTALPTAAGGFYLNEEASGSRVYVGPAPDNQATVGHKHNASYSSSAAGSSSTRSSRSYGTAPLAHGPISPVVESFNLSRKTSVTRIPTITMPHQKGQPSFSTGGRSRAGSVTTTNAGRSRAGSVTRPAPLDIGVELAMGLDALPSPAIEAVRMSVRDSVAIGPPPKRPPPAPPLVVESPVADVVEAVGETGAMSTEEFGYFPKQPSPEILEEVEGESTVRGRGPVLSSRWSIASSSRESLELKEKEKEKSGKKKEKSKSAPSSPGTKRRSMFGSGDAPQSPDPNTGGKRGRLASFLSKFGRGQEKRRSGEVTDDGEDVIHVKGSWEAAPPVPPVPTNPPPLPPSLRSKISLASLRGSLAREDSLGSMPPTPSTLISDWDAAPSSPSSPVVSPRNSRAYPLPNANRLSSISPLLSRARSHSHLSILSTQTFGAPPPQHSQTSPPPSPTYAQASFGSMSAVSLAVNGTQLSPPTSPGFYAGAGFPRSVTSSPRSSFAYPNVQVAQAPTGHLQVQQVSTSPHTSSPLAANASRLASPSIHDSPEQRLTLTVGTSMDYSTLRPGQGLTQALGSPIDFPAVGASLPTDRHQLRRDRGGSAGLAYEDEEDEMDSESLLLEEAKDIVDAHSYVYDSGSSRGSRRESGQAIADEEFDVMDVYGHRRGTSKSSSRHSRSLSTTHSASHSSTPSRSSSLLRLRDPSAAITTHHPRRLAPSASSPDVSRVAKSDIPPPPVPPKDDTYEVLTNIAAQRKHKLSLTGIVATSSAPSPSSSSASPATQLPQTHIRFPDLPLPPRQPSEAAHSTVSGGSGTSGSSSSGRSTPAISKVGGFMTRLRLKSSPSLGSLKTPSYASALVHAAGYMPLDSPPVPTRPPVPARATTTSIPTVQETSKSKFGSSFAKMMGKGRDKEKKALDDADLDEELRNLDLSLLVGGAGGMIGVAKRMQKQKKVPTREELELDEELRKLDPSMMIGGAGGMIGIGR